MHGAVVVLEEFWHTLLALVQDTIVDVRIKVARFLGIIFGANIFCFVVALGLNSLGQIVLLARSNTLCLNC